jgi:ABC-type proline/glycine betaine transport system permease subunit
MSDMWIMMIGVCLLVINLAIILDRLEKKTKKLESKNSNDSE